MPYPRPSLATLLAQVQADMTAQLGYVPLPFSDESILATAAAGLIDDQYGFIEYCFQQCTPFTATSPYIDAWAALKNIVRVAATPAIGSCLFTGTNGTVIPVGTLLVGANGQNYSMTQQFIIGTSTLPSAFVCTQTGIVGNAPIGMSLNLTSPITGANTNTSASTAITGGSNTESDASLRTRMLQAFANPAMGGSLADFQGWCLACPDVTRAWVLPNVPYSGAVTVFPMFDVSEGAYNGFPQGTNGGATSEPRIAPATGDQLAVANYLFPLQPVTSLVVSTAPTPMGISISISGLGITNTFLYSSGWQNTPTTMEASILASLADMFVRNGTALGGTIQINEVYDAISSVSGVGAFTLLSPTAPIITPVGDLPIVGSLVFE